MGTIIFKDKKIIIRKLSNSDFKKAKKFQDFINSLVEEDAQILANKKLTLKEEINFLKNVLEGIKKKNRVFLVAEYGGKIVGTVGIDLGAWRMNHIGHFGIAIRNGFRRIGLGRYLMQEIIKLAKKELKPKPKIILISLLVTNKPAFALYEKMGFKKVSQIPNAIQFKNKLVDEIIMYKYF